ncbi:restriction endonuclease [Paenibacillus sp. FSL M7-0420]|uniref:restriction endonuclease n=1 Tax=Paenibacillus sp. FSL M7-0420 TaxID=2921609 RepID=UPI0030FB9970
MTRYNYSKYIENSYLGCSKEIKGSSPFDVRIKVENQLNRWKEQEKKARSRERQANLKLKAEILTSEAITVIESFRSLLNSALEKGPLFNWDLMYNTDVFIDFSFPDTEPNFKTFSYKEPAPDFQFYLIKYSVPKESLKHKLFPYYKNKLIKQHQIARDAFDLDLQKHEDNVQKSIENFENALQSFNSSKNKAYSNYLLKKEEFEKDKIEHNRNIDTFKRDFENNLPDAVTQYLGIILDNSNLPNELNKTFEIQYDQHSGIAVIDYFLPNIDEIPKVIEYKYIATRKVITSIDMKVKELNQFYEDTIYQLALRTIYEIFTNVYIEEFQSIIFNGWVKGIDKSTGNDFTSCIISLQTNNAEFADLTLSRVSPKECVRKLKGLTAGSLSQMAPVKPIMQINKEDTRFVESKSVLADLNSTDNLAEMPWEDFEHLVRELFSKIFSKEGGEVNVTRASRDGGVDAIAFDPDPIRGGKYVIQAKRYNNVVGVSAVRDLYGTMINEGAVKGILVTTSHFGNDSREFVKDKPITLLDGSNLMHLFKEYGYSVRIDIKAKS